MAGMTTAAEDAALAGAFPSSGTYTLGLNTALCTLNAALTAGTATTSLTVTALASAVSAGDVIQIGLGSSGQRVTASAAAAAGATAISVESFYPASSWAVGTEMVDLTAVGSNELSGGSYAAQPITFAAPSGGAMSSSNSQTFSGLPTGETVVAWTIYSSGTAYMMGTFTTATSTSTPIFLNTGELTVTLH